MTTILLQVVLLASSFQAKPPAVPVDPGVVIARFEKECAGGSKTASCQTLRLQVEGVLLESLVGLRTAGSKVDPKLYRIAARAETPQLASLGLKELLRDPARTPEDTALIVRALDSPYRGPRMTVMMMGQGLDPVKSLITRIPSENFRFDSSVAIMSIVGHRDPEPDPKVAGGYPGARYRHFASSPARGWFTTPDPPEKVIAFFAKGGKKVLSGEEVKAAAKPQTIDPEAYQKEIMAAVASNDAAKMEALIKSVSTPKPLMIDWTAGFEGMTGAGEIRYVIVSPDRAVAVFRDDALRATSIVAPTPSPPPPVMPTDEKELMRLTNTLIIFGH